MKKLNLLLATTAILSAGALMVNAAVDDETIVPVRAEVVHVHNLNATPIDFGRIAVDDDERNNGDRMLVILDSAGIVTYSDLSTVPGYILSNGKKGVVSGTDCEHLSFSSSIDMSIPDGNDDDVHSSANIQCKTVDGEATFYGEFEVDMWSAGEVLSAGNYTGSLTVTEINPEP